MDLVGHPFQFGCDGGLVDPRGFGEQVALTLGQGCALLAKAPPLEVGPFEGQGLDFELGGVAMLLGSGQFGAELCHLTAQR